MRPGRRGRGAWGLRRSFGGAPFQPAALNAGAWALPLALLVSLWKVEDEATAELMKLFYEQWIRNGRDRVDALRQAKLAMLKGKYRHPRQWAAFVFVGDR